MKVHRSPRWLESYYYEALADGRCVAEHISINKNDLAITGGSPSLKSPLHTIDNNYIKLQDFIDSLQEGIDYNPSGEWVHDFWA